MSRIPWSASQAPKIISPKLNFVKITHKCPKPVTCCIATYQRAAGQCRAAFAVGTKESPAPKSFRRQTETRSLQNPARPLCRPCKTFRQSLKHSPVRFRGPTPTSCGQLCTPHPNGHARVHIQIPSAYRTCGRKNPELRNSKGSPRLDPKPAKPYNIET